jgi:hypothetical protein
MLLLAAEPLAVEPRAAIPEADPGRARIGFGLGLVKTLSSIYPGYAPTFTGTVIGGSWGLVCGFVCGAVIALIYNYLQGLCAQWD